MSDPLHPKTLARVEQSIDEQRRLRQEGYKMAMDDLRAAEKKAYSDGDDRGGAWMWTQFRKMQDLAAKRWGDNWPKVNLG